MLKVSVHIAAGALPPYGSMQKSDVKKCFCARFYGGLPCAGVTPGYGDEVIFADGTFIDGSTSELSADGPIRPPYTVYCQGGTHWTHWALAVEAALVAVQLVHE